MILCWNAEDINLAEELQLAVTVRASYIVKSVSNSRSGEFGHLMFEELLVATAKPTASAKLGLIHSRQLVEFNEGVHCVLESLFRTDPCKVSHRWRSIRIARQFFVALSLNAEWDDLEFLWRHQQLLAHKIGIVMTEGHKPIDLLGQFAHSLDHFGAPRLGQLIEEEIVAL